MLKLRSPIETVSKRNISRLGEGFAERIKANYTQMPGQVDETDLLHLVTQPPEIFMMDGGGTSIMSSTTVNSSSTSKVEIINNLINRILVSADAQLTYQDRVYITNILHSLGIKDERKFMKEVRRLTSETRDTNELINLYWENLMELRSLVTQERREGNISYEGDVNEDKRQILHLHEEVNSRLGSGAIYRIIQNFSRSVYSDSYITKEEFMSSEQARVSRELLLQRLRKEVRGEETPLIYRHENIYEAAGVTNEETSISSINERISSAVLMNLIDNIYQAAYEHIDRSSRMWLRTEPTYYESADNTLFRIEHDSALIQYLNEERYASESIRNEERQEIDILKNVLDRRSWSDVRIQQSLGGNTYSSDETLIRINEEGDTGITYREGDETELIHLTKEGDRSYTQVTNEETKDLSERVYSTYQQNMARNERYMSNLRRILGESRTERESVTRTEVMRRSLEALEHPEAFRQELMEAASKEEEQQERFREAVEEALPPEIRELHQLIEQYITVPMSTYRREMLTMRNMDRLYLDIVRANAQDQAPALIEEKEGYTPSAPIVEGALSEGVIQRPETAGTGEPVGLIYREAPQAEEAEVSAETARTRDEVTLRMELERNERELRVLDDRTEILRSELRGIREERESTDTLITDRDTATLITREQSAFTEREELINRELSRIESLSNEMRSRTESIRSALSRIESSSVNERDLILSDTERAELIYSRDRTLSEILSDERITADTQLIQTLTDNVTETVTGGTERLVTQRLTDRLVRSEQEKELELVHTARSERELLSESVKSDTERRREIVEQVTREVIEKWKLSGDVTPALKQERISGETLSFVHRSVENIVDEQLLERLQEEIRSIREKETRNISTLESNETNVTRVVNNTENEVIEDRDEEIRKLVRGTIRRQIDQISEKVYNRIEKQLQSERRRRGL